MEITALKIEALADAPAIRAGLRDLLVDVVDAGGLVHFMAPPSHEEADAFWDGALQSAASGERLPFIRGARSCAVRTPFRRRRQAESSQSTDNWSGNWSGSRSATSNRLLPA